MIQIEDFITAGYRIYDLDTKLTPLKKEWFYKYYGLDVIYLHDARLTLVRNAKSQNRVPDSKQRNIQEVFS